MAAGRRVPVSSSNIAASRSVSRRRSKRAITVESARSSAAPCVHAAERRLHARDVGRVDDRAEPALGEEVRGHPRHAPAEDRLSEVEVLEPLPRQLLAAARGMRDLAHQEHVALVEVAEALRVRHPARVAHAVVEAERGDVRVVLALLRAHQVHAQVGAQRRVFGGQLGDGAQKRSQLVEHHLDCPCRSRGNAQGSSSRPPPSHRREVGGVVAVGDDDDPRPERNGYLSRKRWRSGSALTITRSARRRTARSAAASRRRARGLPT